MPVPSPLAHDDGSVVRVRTTVHLLTAARERDAKEQLAALEDQLMVLRHCSAAPDLDTLEAESRRLTETLAAGAVGLDLTIGRLPSPPNRQLSRRYSDVGRTMRAKAMGLIEAALDAGVLVAEGESLRVADDRVETFERAAAIAAELRRLDALQHQLVDDESSPPPSEAAEMHRRVQQATRTRQALAAIDRLRCRQAAMAEVTEIESLG